MSAKKVSNGRPAERVPATNGKPANPLPLTAADGAPALPPVPPLPGLAKGETFTDAGRNAVSFTEMARRAQKGDEAALSVVRDVLTRPGAADQLGGNLAREVEEKLIGRFLWLPVVKREAIRVKVAQLRADLAGAEPTAVETLLIDQIAVTWLRLHYVQSLYAIDPELTIDKASYYERCLTAAHRRHLSAIKTLAQTRRLAVPALVLAVAGQQVNQFHAADVEVNAGPKRKGKRAIGGPVPSTAPALIESSEAVPANGSTGNVQE